MAEGNSEQHENAWMDAREQLDCVLKRDMDRLLAFQSPPPTALLAVQAAVAVAGLLPGKPEDLDWDQLKPLLSNPQSFLAQLADFPAADKEHVLTTLGPMAARGDFRPEGLLPVSPACAHLCRWCIALYVRSGGCLPEPQHKTPLLPRQKGIAVRGQAAWQRLVKDERQTGPGPASPGTKAEEQAKGSLRIAAMSGEVVAKLPGARAEWSRRDIAARLKESWPAPSGHMYRFISGTTPIKGNASLADLGLDPEALEGAEVMVVTVPVPESVALVESANESLSKLKRAYLKELKAFTTPPPMAALACQAVYAVLHPNSQAERTPWSDCQRMLADTSLLSRLTGFDHDDNPRGVEAALKPFVDHEGFDTERVLMCSLAAGVFCQWSRATYEYSKAVVDE